MSSITRQVVADRRKELGDKVALLTSQLLVVQAEVVSRQTELNQAKADLASLDAWLTANP
jgi:hypothetical protein